MGNSATIGHRRKLVLLATLLLVILGARWVMRSKAGRVAEHPSPSPPSPLVVSAARLAQELAAGSAVVIDARTMDGYLDGHIPGAISVPAESLSLCPSPALALGRWGLSATDSMVVYDDQYEPIETGRLFWLLELAGAAAPRILDGGLEAWRRSGGLLQTDACFRDSTRWGRPPDSTRSADVDYLFARFGEEGTEILDTRGAEVWSATEPGFSVQQWGRAGHIPHSLPFDLASLFLEDGTLMGQEQMRAVLRAAGPRAATPLNLEAEIITYDDGSSNAGALGYLLLRLAGIERARYFPQGWAAWSADSTLPVVKLIDAEQLANRLTRRGAADWPDSTADFVFLDVRIGRDFDLEHVPGAVCLPSHLFRDSLETVVETHWPGIDRAHVPITIYCYGENCVRSRNCATWAARHEFRRLEWFRGGIEEWNRQRRELRKAE